jgi:sugar lactone lactonase YvrE
MAAVVLTASCEGPGSNSLFDEGVTFAPDPTVTSLSPANRFFAGFQTITITGTNFSPTPANNTVWFNNVRATVVSASATQIVVNTPNMVADSIGVKVAVKGAIGFSNSSRYQLEPLFSDATTLPPSTLPVGSAVDRNGFFYISYISSTSAAPLGVGRFDATRVLQQTYVPVQGWAYRAMKIGPDGGLYMLRVAGGVPIVYRTGPAGGATTNWASSVGRAEDLDFDAQGFAWVVGSNETNTVANQRIVRIQDLGASRAVTGYPFVANGTAVKVYNGHLYVGGTRGGVPKIWRFPINPDNTLGAEEEWLDLTSYSSQAVPRSIAFATDGTMFVAVNTTATTQPLLAVSPAKQISEYYPNIIPGSILKMHWIKGTQRVLMTLINPETGNTTRVITMNMQKDGAPFYGIE